MPALYRKADVCRGWAALCLSVVRAQRVATASADRSAAVQDSESLQQGIALTQQGRFEEAIPLLRKVQEEFPSNYAARFNLALCYLGAGEFKNAIRSLNVLRNEGHNNARVNNLLAQAYIGDGQMEAGYGALLDASRQSPTDEKLYAFVADACTDHFAYRLG